LRQMEFPLKLQVSNTGSSNFFTTHGAGFVSVGGIRHTQSIVVTPNEVLTDWPAPHFEGLEETHFEYLLALRPDVVLLGTGATQRFPHPRLYRALIAANIGLECMNTAAACRTYNILAAEDRKVVAAILL